MELVFQKSQVRDLAWVMASPSLLSGSKHVVSNEMCKAIFDNSYDWLIQLDKRPELLIEALAQNKSHRLGYYFEQLVAFWLQQRIASDYFASHIQVFEEKRVLGEFDFLFKKTHSDTLVHWETAVKFYLHYKAKDEKVWWYGPNAQDRLDIKLDRVFHHQLGLSDTTQGKSLLKEKGFENVRSQTFFKGYLFYPVTSDWRHPQILPGFIALDHLKGWWTRINTLELPDYDADHRWVILPRLQWLAPKLIPEEQISGLLELQQLIDLLKQHFRKHQQPVLLAQMVQESDSCWYEITRGFVVGATWPNQ